KEDQFPGRHAGSSTRKFRAQASGSLNILSCPPPIKRMVSAAEEGTMDEYVCITVQSRPGEGQGEFAARLIELWTRMLRQRKVDFEKIYAETTQFEDAGGCWSRQYLVEVDTVDIVEGELNSSGID